MGNLKSKCCNESISYGFKNKDGKYTINFITQMVLICNKCNRILTTLELSKALIEKALKENTVYWENQSEQILTKIREQAIQLYNFANTKYGYPKDPEKPQKQILLEYISETGIGQNLTEEEQKTLLNQVILLATRSGNDGIGTNKKKAKNDSGGMLH